MQVSAAPPSPPAANPLPPDWVADAIFYQVFPQRFANGDATNDPPNCLPWGSTPTRDAMMGGDLAGIQSKLPYIASLGVNALYLNPVFSSPSNHKYNAASYEDVDPHFGGNDALKSLVDATHAQGARIILDGVFNHTGHTHPWFQSVMHDGPKSPHWNAYTVRRWPITQYTDAQGELRSDDYDSWWGYATLPNLNHEDPAVQNYLLRNTDSVAKRWITDYGIDGWRMDAADEVPAAFWREARTQIKAVKPDALILSENWKDASDMLRGDQFDSVMNYRYFQQPAVRFFAHKEISPTSFVRELESPYAPAVRQAMFNLLDSHDAPRFVTESGGDWHRLRPAAIFQMTYVGAPVIYYGDEIGMEGGANHDARRTYPWDHPEQRNTELLQLYQTLGPLRNRERVLRRGEFSVLHANDADQTISYRRFLPDSPRDAIVAINNATTDHTITVDVGAFAPNGTVYHDAITGTAHTVDDGQITLTGVPENFGAVLLRDVT